MKKKVSLAILVLLMVSLVGVAVWFGVFQSVLIGDDTSGVFTQEHYSKNMETGKATFRAGITDINFTATITRDVSENNFVFTSFFVNITDANLTVKKPVKTFVATSSGDCKARGYAGWTSVRSMDSKGYAVDTYYCWTPEYPKISIVSFSVEGNSLTLTNTGYGFRTANFASIINDLCEKQFLKNNNSCVVKFSIKNSVADGSGFKPVADYVFKENNVVVNTKEDVVSMIVYEEKTVVVDGVETVVYVQSPVTNMNQRSGSADFLKRFGWYIGGGVVLLLGVIAFSLSNNGRKRGSKK